MKSRIKLLVSALLLGGGIHAAPAIADATLPSADCGLGPTNTCVVFGDFTVFSLPLLRYYQLTPSTPLSASLQGLTLEEKPNEALINVMTTSASGTKAQGKGTSIDDPYDAMTGQGATASDNLRMLMTSASFGGQFHVPSDPAGGPGANDNILQPTTTVNNTDTYTAQGQPQSISSNYDSPCFTDLNGCLPLWDADVATLRATLADSDLVFFFVNNETGDTGDLLGKDLDVWARVCLTDTQNASNNICFTLDGTGGAAGFASDTQVTDESDILPTSGDVWAHVHSDICVADGTTAGTSNGQVLPGRCSDIGVSGHNIDQSLGQNTGTYAVFNQTLSDLVKDPNSVYDVMTIDFRGAYMNDGGDVLWIGAATVGLCPSDDPRCNPSVPEPGSLALVGLALTGLGYVSVKRRRTRI
jgi:hypothetical protein